MCYEFSLISVKSVVLFGLRLTVIQRSCSFKSACCLMKYSLNLSDLSVCIVGFRLFQICQFTFAQFWFWFKCKMLPCHTFGGFSLCFFLLLHFLTCRVNTYYACCIIIFNICTVITISEIQLFRNGCRILFQLWIFINFHFRFFKNFFIYFFELRNTCFYSRFGSFR